MTPIDFVRWGAAGQEQVVGDPVPPSEAWLIQACGIVTNDPAPYDYMMQLERGGHFHPLKKNEAPQGSTPVLAVERAFVMGPGDCLRARVNAGGNPQYQGMALLYAGWAFPVSQLPQLLLGGSAVDVSAFVAQCQSAAQALASIEAP